MESHEQYELDQLPWPDLDSPALERLRAVPFWEEVLHTERVAGAKVDAYAATISDPLLREAVAVQGVEEARHARLLQFMIQHYGIEAAEHPLDQLPDDIETAFIDFGYGECLDAFLGFGVFKIARQAEFLPEPLFAIFDLLMQEETRHILARGALSGFKLWLRSRHAGERLFDLLCLARMSAVSVAMTNGSSVHVWCRRSPEPCAGCSANFATDLVDTNQAKTMSDCKRKALLLVQARALLQEAGTDGHAL
jgi:hypothetical protein